MTITNLRSPPGEITEPEFATIPGTRKLIGLSRATLYQLEEEGEIRFIRVIKEGKSRGRVLVDLGSVRRFLNGCAEGKVRGSKTEESKADESN